MGYPANFKGSSSSGFGDKKGNSSTPSAVSLKSENSMGYPANFKGSSSSGFGDKKGNSSTPSAVSLKSENSMGYPANFKGSSSSGFAEKKGNSYTPSAVSLKSENSMGYPANFKGSSSSGSEYEIPEKTSSFHTDLNSVFERLERETVTLVRSKLKKLHQLLTPSYSTPLWRHNVNEDMLHSGEAEKIFSRKKEEFMNFLQEFLRMMKHGYLADALSSSDSVMSPSKDKDELQVSKLSEDDDQHLKSVSNKLRHQHRTPQKENMDSVFENLEGNIVTFVESELRSFHKLLNPQRFPDQDDDDEAVNWEENEQKTITKEAFLNMILGFLKRMKQEELAVALQNKSVVSKCQSKLKSTLKTRLAYVFEGIAKEGRPTLLNKIYTELYITEGREEIICDHEVKHFEKALKKIVTPLTIRCEDIFKPSTESDKPVRTVMTEGVAGIGKTVLTKKFALDWAEGRNNQHIQFTFPFSFRGLNMVKEKTFSLVELIHLFFPEIKEAGICSFEHFRVLFIFDGLDECRFPLDLKTKEVLTDVKQSSSLEVLLANLIKGRLLPSARIWVTTRPAAAHQIPPEFVDLMTEVRGFNDAQKKEYFRKRFKMGEESKMVISHIKSSRSLYIMCHIPVFCWIIATVLEDAIKNSEEADLPNSLTEMYILFLVVLSKVKNVKYDKKIERDPLWTPETREMIKSLGKLAFEQLMKGNLFFYESDLTECGIDVRAASVYSGVFTEIFQEEKGFFHQNMFCFVHLSIQEFLAALHVHLTFTNTGVNLLSEEESVSHGSKMSGEQFENFYKNAVDKTLKSPNGHLDLFLRFLLGLSQKTNQRLLQGFVGETEIPSSSIQNVAQYIKKQIEEILCPYDKANFFYCLNELKDNSLVKEIERSLKSGKLETEKMSSVQWATLMHILLYSEDYQESFDLRKYFVSTDLQERFLPLLINISKAVLGCCSLNETSYGYLVCVLTLKCCLLTDLDLSNNDMKDSGLKLLCEGLSNNDCKVETLRLSGCLITKEGCAVLASALASNPSHLKELDLSYNHPEESGVALLSAGLENPNWALQTLRFEPSGLQFLKPGLKKYAVELVLDPPTAHSNLTLTDCNRKVTVGQGGKLPCSDNPERFDAVEQLLGRDGLSGHCYWEVEWSGRVHIGVTYKRMKRRGGSDDCHLGKDDQSWALSCTKDGLFALHNNKRTELYVEPSIKVGVYLDWPGGTVSFFRVSPDSETYLHSFNTKFTKPVYPAFRIEPDPINSSLTLCLTMGDVPPQAILEKSIVAFIKNELKNFQKQQDHKETCLSQEEDVDEKRSSKDAFLSISQQFLKRMKYGEAGSSLLNSVIMSQRKVKEQAHLPGNDGLSLEHHIQARAERVHQKPVEDFNTRQTNLSSVFKMLEEDLLNFAKNELKTFHKILSVDYPESSESQGVEVDEEEDENRVIKKAFLKIALDFMKNMKQEELAHALQNKSVVTMCQQTLKSNLKNRFAYVFEGMDKARNPTLLNQIYTELYITEGTPAEVNCKHEVKLIERALLRSIKPEITIRCEDIFKPSTGRDKPIRTVMTEGVAGIGKTVLTKKFALDWAEGKIYQDIQFIFPLSFRELNMLMRKRISLAELIHLFFPEIKEAGIHSFEEFRVLFIFDGLDECRLPLDLKTKEVLTDVTQPSSLDVMLTNLIKGRLLPSAHIWITTRPAAAHQIPPEFVDLVTEVRGFNDAQKKEYFRKRFKEEEESRKIISHINSSRSIFIMCHIPVFCWITATVLEDAIKTKQKRALPKTLTDMYIYFLVVLSKVKNVKYDKKAEKDSLWTPETRDMIQSLGKLAFEQLMKGNLFFYESDLTECGIDVRAASVYSGVFTEIFQEERGLYHENVFCFVHLSIQEFLAALHVHLTFTNTGVNLLSEEESASTTFEDFHQCAVDKAVQSPNGHLDLFLRFLLGLSLKINQTFLQGLITGKGTGSSSSQNTIKYIKKKIGENVCIMKNNNLFHCLNELKDCSLVEEIQAILRPGRLPADKLSPTKWAALVNIILSSKEKLDEFYLNNYFESDNAVIGLRTVIINSTKAVLSCCNLTEMSCSGLASALQSKCSLQKELDLSNNDLKDSGVKLLCEGLRSPHCTLETLSLSGCLITKEGCAELVSSLRSNPSHLKELDLSYNHPEESGVKHLTAGQEDSRLALQTLRIEPSGSQFLKPGLRKYACELMLDPNSTHKNIIVSDNNRKVTIGEVKQPYPDHPERFDVLEQLLCKDGLTGRCYWEVEWKGRVHIAATYRRIKRKGGSDDCSLGQNDESWSLLCSDDGHSGLHKNKMTSIHGAPSSRVGVYLDWPGGILSFFAVSSGKVTHLHTFHTKFTEPLYPAFRISTEPLDSSLCFSYI
ncbi:uncharacterized protein FYW61_006646 [Anableps anableps]